MKIKDYKISEETVKEIGRFAILWSDFEREFFNYNCCPKEIIKKHNKIFLNKENQQRFADVLNERRHWYERFISESEYVDDSLHPEGVRRSDENHRTLMKKFMMQEDGDLRCGCLLIICRIRNNMMHGLKSIEELDDQQKLFRAMNDLLESTRWI